jgi:hypothetical protein
MPRAGSTKPDPDAVYLAWMAFHSEHGSVATGERRRGDDEMVINHFGYFLPDGTPRHKWPEPWHAAVRREEAEDPPPDADLHLPVRPVEAEPIVVLTRPLRVSVGTTITGRAGEVIDFAAGARFTASAQIVRELPSAFEPEGKTRRRKRA